MLLAQQHECKEAAAPQQAHTGQTHNVCVQSTLLCKWGSKSTCPFGSFERSTYILSLSLCVNSGVEVRPFFTGSNGAKQFKRSWMERFAMLYRRRRILENSERMYILLFLSGSSAAAANKVHLSLLTTQSQSIPLHKVWRTGLHLSSVSVKCEIPQVLVTSLSQTTCEFIFQTKCFLKSK